MSSVKSKAGQASPAEWKRLRARLEELEATVTAIRRGDVDAIVVDDPQGSQIYPAKPGRPLPGAGRTDEREQQAALTSDGTIVFCNQRLAEMMGVPRRETAGGFPGQHVVRAGTAGRCHVAGRDVAAERAQRCRSAATRRFDGAGAVIPELDSPGGIGARHLPGGHRPQRPQTGGGSQPARRRDCRFHR